MSGCFSAPLYVDYIVQPGDKLSMLSWATGESAESIAKRNNITDPDHIVAGQKIALRSPNSCCDNASRFTEATNGSVIVGLLFEPGNCADIAERFKLLMSGKIYTQAIEKLLNKPAKTDPSLPISSGRHDVTL